MVTLRGDILTEWMSRSACRHVPVGPDKDDFFGVSENAPMKGDEVAASKQICRTSCPVQWECLKAALSAEEGWGVWGGYTAPERLRAMKIFKTVRRVMEAFDDGILDAAVVRRVR